MIEVFISMVEAAMENDRNRDSKTTGYRLSRRKMLALTAGGSISALAGCSSNPEASDDSPNQSDKQFVRRALTVPTEAQYNPFTASGVDWYTMSLIHGFPNKQTRKKPTHLPLLLKNWEINGKTFTMELNDQFTWHDGTTVTAEHVVLQFEICKHMQAGKQYPPLEYLDGLPKATGSTTVEATLKKKLNPDVFFNTFFGEPFWYQPNFFKPYVEEFRNASGDSAKKKIRTEITNTNLDKPIGFGPLKFKNADAQKVVYEFHDGYPFELVQQQASDALGNDYTSFGRPNFSTVISKVIDSDDKLSREILGGKMDAAVTSLTDQSKVSEQGKLFSVPTLHGHSINYNMFDWGETPGPSWLTDPQTSMLVRKALIHAIDRDAAGKQLAGGNPLNLDPKQTGLRKPQEEKWLDQSLLDSMNEWEYDPKKAAEYMKQAGFTKSGGKWMDPDGNPVTLTLREGSGVTRYINGLDVVNSNLQEFGIDTEMSMKPNSTYFSKDANDNGTDVGIDYWGGASPLPYDAFDWMYLRISTQRENGEYDYYLPRNEKLQVPPLGKPDSDKTITVDPKALIDEMSVTTDEKRQQEIINKLAWATNQAVPQITSCERSFSQFLDTKDWNYPSLKDPIMYMNPSANMMFHFGVVQAAK